MIHWVIQLWFFNCLKEKENCNRTSWVVLYLHPSRELPQPGRLPCRRQSQSVQKRRHQICLSPFHCHLTVISLSSGALIYLHCCIVPLVCCGRSTWAKNKPLCLKLNLLKWGMSNELTNELFEHFGRKHDKAVNEVFFNTLFQSIIHRSLRNKLA